MTDTEREKPASAPVSAQGSDKAQQGSSEAKPASAESSGEARKDNKAPLPPSGKKRFNPLKPGGPRPKGGFFYNLIVAVIILFVLTGLYSAFSEQEETPEIPISQLATDVQKGIVSEIKVEESDLEITYLSDEVKISNKEEGVALSETLIGYGVTSEQLQAVTIDIEKPSGFVFWLVNLAPFLLPLVFIIFFIWYLSRQVKGAGMQAFKFGESKARIIMPSDKKQRITFKDVAGVKEAKEELKEIVDFLKNPKKFLDIGAKIPKGIILMGAPGTGKTLLARAVAGEANVAFFSISASEFVEMFVGVGASRVRDLFKLAKKSAPAIIFVDEIDAIGRTRGVGAGGGNDEREQTLNQILVEMDGFEPREKVIVMAATNRPDVLDKALLRPGRFDRRVTLDLPDRKDREEILKIHAREKPLKDDVDMSLIATRTPGFSGADLESLVNESAILAARENHKEVSQFDLIRSIERVMLGPERKSHILSKKEKQITAYHEAGHALLASILPNADPVHKISIISRGRTGGYTLKLPTEDRRLQSRKEFLDDIVVSLGGFVAEKMEFDDLTTGSSNDLQVSTSLARDMITKYGMSDSMGPIAFDSGSSSALFGQEVSDKGYSEEVGAKIDEEVSKTMSEAKSRAEEILSENREVLKALAERLIDVETIERDEYEKLLEAKGITVKERSTNSDSDTTESSEKTEDSSESDTSSEEKSE